MAVEELEVGLAPLLQILAMKLEDKKAASAASRAYVQWCSEGRKGTLHDWMAAHFGLAIDLDQKSSKQTSFLDADDPYAMRRAAGYVDAWYKTNKSVLRVYYLCMTMQGD